MSFLLLLERKLNDEYFLFFPLHSDSLDLQEHVVFLGAKSLKYKFKIRSIQIENLKW